MNNNNERELELLTIRQLMSNENGRKFIWRCLQHTGLYGSVFNKDTNLHAFKSGLREHGIWLEREVKDAAPETFITMLKENMDE